MAARLALLPRALLASAVLLFANCLPVVAASPVENAFTVRAVPLDVTAASAAAARDQAFADAQRIAFRRLLERLTVPAEYSRLPSLSLQAIEDYVRDISVDQEKSLGQRYLAQITVRFQPPAIRKLLRDAGIAFSEPRQRPIAVVPLFSTGDQLFLWTGANPWRDAFAKLPGEGLVSFAVPSGEQADQIDATRAMSADAEALTAVARRMGTPDALIAHAYLGKDATGRPSLDVRIAAMVGGLSRPFETRNYQASGDEEPQDLIRRAIADLTRALEEAHKQGNTVRYDQTGELSTIVPLSGDLAGWMSIRERLVRLPIIRGIELISLSRNEAAMIIRFAGEQSQVEGALAQVGLPIVRSEGFWVMQSGASGPGAAGTR